MALAITSPSDKNITVGDPIDIQWVASGGTASAVNFVRKDFPSATIERTYDMASSADGTLYASTGYTPTGTDGNVYKSIDNGETYTLYKNVSTAQSVQSIECSDNDVLYAVYIPTGGQSIDFYKNTTLITSLTVWSTCYASGSFSNGNVVFGVGDHSGSEVNAQRIYLYKKSDGSFTHVFTGVVSTNSLRMSSCVVADDGVTGYMCDYNGKVYNTTNSGLTWSNISTVTTTYGRMAIGKDTSGNIIVWSEGLNDWRISTDGGATWGTWAGKPNLVYKPWNRIRTEGSIIAFGDMGTRTLSVFSAGSWAYNLIGTASIEQVWTCYVKGGNTFAGTGLSAGDGSVYKSQIVPVYIFNLYKLPSLLIDSKTNTTGNYLYTDTADLSDTGSW